MEKLSVKKPFTIFVAVVMILVLGVVSVSSMTMDLLPDMSMPYLIVVTTYPGASPERVESDVVRPLESALGTVSGVQNVYSTSAENYGMVQLEFADGTNMDSTLVKVNSALQEVSASLPEPVTRDMRPSASVMRRRSCSAFTPILPSSWGISSPSCSVRASTRCS